MRRKNIALCMILAFAIGFSGIACGKGKPSHETPPTPAGTIKDTVQHYYTGGLHKFNMTKTDTVFVENKSTDYVVVTSAAPTNSDLSCAAYITRFIAEALGANIGSISESDASYSSDKKYIAVNCRRLFGDAGLRMPDDDIKENGYYIKSAGNSVFIMSNDDGHGARNGGIEFLRQTIGLEFFDGASYSFDENLGNKVNMPGFDITETPDIQWNTPTNNISAAAKANLRSSETPDLFMNVAGGTTWHNSLQWLPVASATAEQREYWYMSNRRELCYTAHGNKEMYDEMIRRCVDKAIASVNNNPSKKVLTLTIMDGAFACECDACVESKRVYGTDSAAYIKFVNDVGRGLDKYLTELAERNGTEKRDVTLLIFGYNHMTMPPVKEENGNPVPIDDSVVLYDNVGVFYAPIGMQYNESLYADANAAFYKATKGWRALTDNMYVWYYDTNFFEYLYPFNSWGSLPESYRCLAENNTIYLYNLGQFNQGQDGNTGFAVFKEYMNQQLRWNVNQTYAELTDRFFKGYFKEAEQPMRRFFDELTAHIEYLEDVYPTSVHGGVYHHPTDATFWPQRTLRQWLGYIDEAYAAIKPLRDSDPVKYGILYNNILKESIFPRYALLTIYEGSFSASELQAERIAFKADCSKLNVTRHLEAGSLSAVYEGWGI